MRISFDIDDTLILHGSPEPQDWNRFAEFVPRWLGMPLRRGARDLIAELRSRGCSVWIYTSSGRSPLSIYLWLYLNGVRIDGVVNGDRHRRVLAGRKFSRIPSKYPPAFGIDLHVDDSDGVAIEGRKHGFRVIVVESDDQFWADKVLAAISNR